MRLLTIATITTSVIQAQYWAAKQDGSDGDETQSVATDPMGNVYIAGYSGSTSISAYDASGMNVSTIPISGPGGAFLFKYSPAGQVLWVARQDSVGYDKPNKVATDKQGNVYVAGYYMSPLNVYDARGVVAKSLPMSGTQAGYLVKYISNGSVAWATRQVSSGANIVNAMFTDSQDYVYIGGEYTATLGIFNAQNVNVKSLTLTAGQAGFFIKYASNGSYIWALKLDGPNTGSYNILGCSVDQNDNVIMTGYYYTSSMAVYDALGANVKTLTVSGSNTCASYAIKYTSNGNFLWAARQDGSDLDFGYGISASSTLVYVAGQYFSSSLVIYDQSGTNVKSVSRTGSSSGSFVVAYWYNGSYAWVARQTNPFGARTYDSAVDVQGNILMAGYCEFDSCTIYDRYDTLVKSLSINGNQGAFTINYFSNGSLNWVVLQDGLASESSGDVTVDLFGNVYAVGYYIFAPLFIYDAYGSLIDQSLLQSGSQSGYVVKYNRNGLWNTSHSVTVQQGNDIPSSASIFTTSYQSSNSLLTSSSTTFISLSLTTSTPSSQLLSGSSFKATQNFGTTSSYSSQSLNFHQISTNADDQVQLYYSQQGYDLSSTQSSQKDLKVEQIAIPTGSINIVVFVSIATAVLIGLFIVTLICCLRRRRKLVTRALIKTDSFTATEMSNTTGITGMTTTAMVTSHVLAVPQYLALQFGVDVRQLDEIARGGGGTINHCQVLDTSKLNNYDNSKLVIKNLGKDAIQLTDVLQRSFYQEISMLYMFRDQPYFAKLIGFTEQPATIVLKYYELGSLMQYIMGKNSLTTRFKYSKRQLVMLQVKLGLGLAFVHSKQFAHCDIKPDNVLLEQVGSYLEPRITDFGISRLLDKSVSQVQAFQLSKVRGASIRYAAPEVIDRFRQHLVQSDPDIWKSGDVYALAAVWQEMLTRRAVWSLSP